MNSFLSISLIIASIASTVSVYAQEPDPRLFQTWYLYATEVDLGDTDNYFGDDVPVMTIHPDLTFVAAENCWEYDGAFTYVEDYDFYSFGLDVINHTALCSGGGSNGQILHLLYEFEEILGAEIYESPVQTLALETYPGFIHTFRNEKTFSIEEDFLQRIKLYPNPITSELRIQNPEGLLGAAVIYSANGKRLKTVENLDTPISFSDQPSGIYFIELFIENQRIVQKIVKR